MSSHKKEIQSIITEAKKVSLNEGLNLPKWTPYKNSITIIDWSQNQAMMILNVGDTVRWLQRGLNRWLTGEIIEIKIDPDPGQVNMSYIKVKLTSGKVITALAWQLINDHNKKLHPIDNADQQSLQEGLNIKKKSFFRANDMVEVLLPVYNYEKTAYVVGAGAVGMVMGFKPGANEYLVSFNDGKYKLTLWIDADSLKRTNLDPNSLSDLSEGLNLKKKPKIKLYNVVEVLYPVYNYDKTRIIIKAGSKGKVVGWNPKNNIYYVYFKDDDFDDAGYIWVDADILKVIKDKDADQQSVQEGLNLKKKPKWGGTYNRGDIVKLLYTIGRDTRTGYLVNKGAIGWVVGYDPSDGFNEDMFFVELNYDDKIFRVRVFKSDIVSASIPDTGLDNTKLIKEEADQSGISLEAGPDGFLSPSDELGEGLNLPKKQYSNFEIGNVEDTDATGGIGTLYTTYDRLINAFGDSLGGDNYKTDAQWVIKARDIVLTIYNYKDGINYNGEDGIPEEEITDWRVGSNVSDIPLIVIKSLEHLIDGKFVPDRRTTIIEGLNLKKQSKVVVDKVADAFEMVVNHYGNCSNIPDKMDICADWYGDSLEDSLSIYVQFNKREYLIFWSSSDSRRSIKMGITTIEYGDGGSHNLDDTNLYFKIPDSARDIATYLIDEIDRYEKSYDYLNEGLNLTKKKDTSYDRVLNAFNVIYKKHNEEGVVVPYKYNDNISLKVRIFLDIDGDAEFVCDWIPSINPYNIQINIRKWVSGEDRYEGIVKFDVDIEDTSKQKDEEFFNNYNDVVVVLPVYSIVKLIEMSINDHLKELNLI